MFHCSPRTRAGVAILLIVAAAGSGMAARLWLAGTPGQLFFLLTRLGMVGLPWLWVVWVDQKKPTISLPSRQQGLIGLLLGTAMVGIILSAYWFLGQPWIDPAAVRSRAEPLGLTSPIVYGSGALYFTFINSLVEEYIWRWFICQQWEVILPQTAVPYLAGLCFTLHHSIVLLAYTGSWLVVALGSFGVFAAGTIWAWCYLRYRSLWACYLSHLLADLAIALVGWQILFLS